MANKIPPARLRELAAEALGKISALLSAQALCPEPFKMSVEELAAAVLHHANAAAGYSRKATEQEAEPADGELLGNGCRWCAVCKAKHGAAFICPNYSPKVRALVDAYESPNLAEGVPGSGVTQLVAQFRRRR